VLTPPESGDVRIGFTGQDGYRVWLDGTVVTEDWNIHEPATTLTKKIHLDKDHPYLLKIEYFQNVGNAEARLLWSLPSQVGQDALDAASKADLVVMVAGLSPRIEGEEMKVQADGFAGGDRTSLDLPAPQEELLRRIQALGKPTVLVLMNGSAVAINWADANLPAIVEAWYPGEEGGTAVAGLLAGDFSPAGRLPVTFYKSAAQLPPFDDYSMAKRTYRYFGGQPLYPFGYGLSYTTFQYGKLAVDKTTVSANGEITATVEVQNTGAMAGDEVAQLYLTHSGVPGAPIRALKGFQRVHLNRGEKTVISFTLRDRDLSVVDEDGKHHIRPGKVDVWIGGSQPVTRSGVPPTAGGLTQFTIADEATLPD
jgi:beta-glucosidase